MNQPLPNMPKPISRRTFLSLTGTLSLGVATVGIPLPAEAVKFNRTLYKVSKSRLGMGTFINMIVFHPSKGETDEAMGRAFEEINRLTSLMTRFQSTSYIGHLNSSGTLREAPPEVMEVLRSSLHYHTISQGAFDITVMPIVDLYQRSFQANNSPPSPRALRETMERVGSQHLRITNDSVSFARSGMEVTLDGIAKGYIIDRAMTVLRQQGLQHALINAGGDIVLHGGKGEGKPWKIGIQDPWNRKGHVDVVTLNTGAIATSGNYEVFFDRERLFHHLIRPNSGNPAPETASVTIRAASCMEADAIATSVYVMGPGRGNQFIGQLPSIEGLVINSQRKKMPSSGWNRI
ncbi:MAG: FAD:protein FMN transferase [Deltaproteobacteria bacterium]|nr:MAG: FAD:protein FMN transferase [Deltaproteobacteria bacterium]